MLLRVQPGGIGMIDWAESHALEAPLLNPVTQAAGWIRLERMQQAMSYEQFRVAVERIVDIRVIPAIVARIDQHRITQAEFPHLLHLVLDRRLLSDALELGVFG